MPSGKHPKRGRSPKIGEGSKSKKERKSASQSRSRRRSRSNGERSNENQQNFNQVEQMHLDQIEVDHQIVNIDNRPEDLIDDTNNVIRANLNENGLEISMEVNEAEEASLDADQQNNTNDDEEGSEEGELLDEDNEVQFNVQGRNNNATTSDTRRVVAHCSNRNQQQPTEEMRAMELLKRRFADQDTNNQRVFFDQFSNWMNGKKKEDRNEERMHKGNDRANEVKQRKPQGQGQIILSPSEMTIYKRAVALSLADGDENVQQVSSEKRESSSSEELINTSDESALEERNDLLPADANTINDQISGIRRDVQRREHFVEDGQMPHCSRQPTPRVRSEVTRVAPRNEPSSRPEDRADDLIRQAELAKARIFEVPGNVPQSQYRSKPNYNELIHAVLVDESYSSIDAHVDESVKRKIANHEYIDFARLIPRGRGQSIEEEEQGMQQIVSKDGFIFCLPANKRLNDATAINSIHRWEQAFRIFAHIYTRAHPNRASELMQYNFDIHSAAQSYSWDNVYAYDRDFRYHMSRNPGRSWGIALQRAWNNYMRNGSGNGFSNGRNSGATGGSGDRNRASKRELCWKFNQGKCTYGLSCKFDHRCALCMKFGHGAHNCRRGPK